MAIIPQQKLFGWEEIEKLSDLERLRLALENMPDEELMQSLEIERGRGRDDYPVRAVWNSILAGVVYQHPSVESLRRELLRNGQLRQMCGIDKEVVPSWVYSRFLKKLFKKTEEVEAIFDRLVEQAKAMLPGFGEVLAIDGKAIDTHARPRKQEGEATPDGRRDGSLCEKVKTWFGYKLHLIIEANYELPVAFSLTRASGSEVPQAHALLTRMETRHPGILEECKEFLGDKGYDDGKLHVRLWDGKGIKPVIDIRNHWKDGEKTRLVTGQSNVVYDYRGTVYCHCPATDKEREMAYGGFEKDRNTLKYRCPARHYGISCKGLKACPVKGSVRIPLSEDRRIFTPIARSSYRWKTLYRRRKAVERVNSRLDVSFGFENHFIRGLKKMHLRCSLALSVMLTMALGRVKEKQEDKLRSLVQAA
ncbi:MAG: transposase [Bacillota bacterium]